MSIIKGYKVTLPDYTSKNGKDKWPWISGETYTYNGNINWCGSGFHFCQNAADCFSYYDFNSQNHIFQKKTKHIVLRQNNISIECKAFIENLNYRGQKSNCKR